MTSRTSGPVDSYEDSDPLAGFGVVHVASWAVLAVPVMVVAAVARVGVVVRMVRRRRGPSTGRPSGR